MYFSNLFCQIFKNISPRLLLLLLIFLISQALSACYMGEETAKITTKNLPLNKGYTGMFQRGVYDALSKEENISINNDNGSSGSYTFFSKDNIKILSGIFINPIVTEVDHVCFHGTILSGLHSGHYIKLTNCKLYSDSPVKFEAAYSILPNSGDKNIKQQGIMTLLDK